MLKYAKGNLLKANVDIICHGCNMVGVMGAGIAKQIKEKFPQAYKDYRNRLHLSKLGDNIISYIPTIQNSCHQPDLTIVNMLTQENISLGEKAVSYYAISKCFYKLGGFICPANCNEFSKIGIPKIGAGLGGGDWNIIEELINEAVDKFNLDVTVYEL